LLIKAGHDITQKTTWQYRASLSAKRLSEKALNQLLDAGADPAAANASGTNVLMNFCPLKERSITGGKLKLNCRKN
jgi:hypothetical protein